MRHIRIGLSVGLMGMVALSCEGHRTADEPVETTTSSLTVPPTVAEPTLRATTPDGRVPGSAAVSTDGAFTYSIPIETPKGRAGMEPELSLEYSSRGGNGI